MANNEYIAVTFQINFHYSLISKTMFFLYAIIISYCANTLNL